MELFIDCRGNGEVLEELASWLAQESELRGRVTRRNGPPSPGTLGASDLLVVAMESGGVLSVLAASLKAFLSLPRRSDISIVLKSKDGTSLEIDAKRVSNPELLIRETFGHGE